MLGLFGKIFGSEEAIEATVKTVAAGLDALVYTDEERAKDAAADRAAARGMMVEWMRTTQGQNLSRRFLAFLIATSWAATHFTAVVLNVVAVFIHDPAKILAAGAIISNEADNMNAPFMLVLGFYFAAPHLDKFVKPVTDKFLAGKGSNVSS